MITYEYACKNCDANFSVEQSIKDDAFTVCPECEQESLYRVMQVPLHISIKGEPVTVGQLAEQNAKHMSSEEMRRVQERYKTAKTINRIPEEHRPASVPNQADGKTPDWLKKSRTKQTKDINKLSPEATKKYIMTGE